MAYQAISDIQIQEKIPTGMTINDGSESTIDLTALRAPTARHYVTKVSQRTLTKALTTVIEPGIDVAADIAAIRAGRAHQTGNEFSINGRTYGVHGRRLYPISGPGFHPSNRGAFKALGVYNQFGDSPRAAEIFDQSGIGHAERMAALRAWTAAQGGSTPMFWEDLLVDRDPTDDEIGTALAAAFSIPREDIAVVDGPIEEAVDADARILGERFAMAGDFPTRLSIFLRDATLEDRDWMATVRRLCAELGADCLVSDESVNPYTMILVTASGTEQAVALDPERVDDHDEYVLAKPPSRQFATPRGA